MADNADNVVDLPNPTAWKFMTSYKKAGKRLKKPLESINSNDFCDEDRKTLLKMAKEIEDELEQMKQRLLLKQTE